MRATWWRLLARLRAPFDSRQLDRDLDDELATHLALRRDELVRRGLSPEAAERAARLELGGATQLREAHREVRGLPLAEILWNDVRYGLRTLWRDVSFAGFAILIIGLGLGASAAVFNLVSALLIRPLPFTSASQLVWLSNLADDGVAEWTVQVNHFLDLREQNRTFSDLAGYYNFMQAGDRKLTGSGDAERLSSIPVTQNFFALLGIEPHLGRTFTADECRFGGPAAIMLSHRLWQRRFASNPGIVGQRLTINDAPVTVVGVLPEWFDFGSVFSPGRRIDLYMPFPLSAETNRGGNTLAVIGRLKPGVTIDAARADLSPLATRLMAQNPDRNSLRPRLRSLDEHVSGHLRTALGVLAAAVAVVMLIVCTNLASLQLARAASRRRELAIRAALGASRWRLMEQTLVESLLVCGAGALLGGVIAFVATRLLTRVEAFSLPLLDRVTTDFWTFGFLAAMALVCGIAIGVAPAWQTPARTPQDALQEGTRGASEGPGSLRARHTLIVVEIAFACVLLVGAGLLIRSFLSLVEVDLGFRPDHVTAVRIDPSRNFPTDEARNAYYDEALRRARAIPGVDAAGLSDILPLDGDRSRNVSGQGQVYKEGEYPEGFVRVVSESYVAAMGLRLLAGRDFENGDRLKTDKVAIVNESLAKRLWPDRDPIGQMVLTEGRASGPRRVVGVVSAVRHRALEREGGYEVYLPMRQTFDYASTYLVLRSSLAPATVAASLRQALAPIAPDVAVNQVRELRQIVDRAISPRRLVVWLLGGFAAFALLLAALGIYAVVAYAVSQRAQEFGIRLALGASARDVRRRVLTQTLRLAAVGIAIGGVAALLLAGTLSGLLYDVTAADPLTFAVMALTLGLVALAAGYLPARRASRLDPLRALRHS